MAQQEIKYSNNLFSNHFLEERIQDLEEWNKTDVEEKFEELKELYEKTEGFLSEELNEDQTQDKFINPILKALNHEWVPEARTRVGSKKKGTVLNPDYTFMGMDTQMDVHEDGDLSHFDVNYAVGDAKAWNRTLDKSTQDHRNPAFQIYNYVDRLRADWGILTNGKKWRLYSYEDCAADIFFEINLEKLLQGEKTEEKLQAFKYFYLFFRRESFESEGQSFLEKVYQESVNYAEGLEDDLEDKIYKALEATVKGFFETNDLEKNQENIDLVHRSSLIYLYRNLFILNAESRGLLPVDNEIYRAQLSFEELKEKLIEEEEDAFPENTWLWQERISNLFDAINNGRDYGDFEIPAYNGGLFDHEESEENQFLAENQLQGNYIREVLELLSTTRVKDQKVLVDYKDLNIRHLGSVYEGLLEHEFRAADERKLLEKGEWKNLSESDKAWEEIEKEKKVEENELYLTNESGERKATGSYYTPEYIVEYIVENTVGPKVDEKIEEAEENGDNTLTKMLELNVCDPAMGSGHFLTEATEFIAEHIVEHADLEKQDIDENEDELNWAKRQVVQNCIYGVDINELAVELGKLSLWIETMAEGKPLNFLDHHLKHGNSLIGSDFDEIFTHPTEKQKRLDSEDFNFSPEEARDNFQSQYKEIEEMPENTVEQIHEKEQAYKQFIQENVLYQQFQQLANIHTRQYFEKEANSSDYESFLINVGNESNPFENTEWYKNAQQDSENRNYFHWQLEFPKVFFGQKQGFDAVIGNPPYIRSITLKNANKEVWKHLKERYETASHKEFDIYACFTEKGSEISSGRLGYILPNKFFTAQFAKPMRELLIKNNLLDGIVDFNAYQIFDEVTTYTCLMFLEENSERMEMTRYNGDLDRSVEDLEFQTSDWDEGEVKYSDLGSEPWDLTIGKKKEVLDKIGVFDTLGDYGRVWKGTGTNADDVFVVDKVEEQEDLMRIFSPEREQEYVLEKDLLNRCVKGKDIEQNNVSNRDRYLITPYDDEGNLISPEAINENYPKTYDYFLENREILEERESGRFAGPKFYCFGRPQNMDKMDKDKLLLPAIVNEGTAVNDDYDYWVIDSAYFFIAQEDINLSYVSSLLNSSLMSFFLKNTSTKMRGGYYSMKSAYSEPFPMPQGSKNEEFSSELAKKDKKLVNSKKELQSINTNIQDYLGNYSDGKTLGDLYTPVEGLSEKIVSDTSADRDSLRIGSVEFEERNDQLILKVSARYKPEDSENIDEDELDRWGYFETGKVPAMKFNVDDKMRPLIEEFVSLAVDEAGGFAGFRESATKTNSVIDRLEKLTLPKLEDVDQGLEKFIENREEAEALEEEIQETDELIDAIVFDLYDLTEEEVETVLDSLDTSEGEKERILEQFSKF